MKTNRRDFFRIAGIAGAGAVTSGLTSCIQKESGDASLPLAYIKDETKKAHTQLFNMSGYAAPKIETVRVGIVGLGMRGPGAVERLTNIEGVDIKALCDKKTDRVVSAQKILEDAGLPRAKEYSG